jgi:hypothetical protein
LAIHQVLSSKPTAGFIVVATWYGDADEIPRFETKVFNQDTPIVSRINLRPFHGRVWSVNSRAQLTL